LGLAGTLAGHAFDTRWYWRPAEHVNNTSDLSVLTTANMP